VNPADKRLIELVDKWITSLELHLKYSSLDEASYWKVQPWVKHERPSRWIIELARQKAQQLKEQIDARIAMGDAKYSDSLELMGFLTNLVGSQNIARFIPLAEPQSEVDLAAASASTSASVPIGESTRVAVLTTAPRKAIVESTREMPRPPAAPTTLSGTQPTLEMPRQESARREPARAEPRKAARGKGQAQTHKARDGRTIDPRRELKVIADAVRLLGWGRKWHELAELISRMADRPPIAEVRRILRDQRETIQQQSGTNDES
jgi:hypothetical protein